MQLWTDQEKSGQGLVAFLCGISLFTRWHLALARFLLCSRSNRVEMAAASPFRWCKYTFMTSKCCCVCRYFVSCVSGSLHTIWQIPRRHVWCVRVCTESEQRRLAGRTCSYWFAFIHGQNHWSSQSCTCTQCHIDYCNAVTWLHLICSLLMSIWSIRCCDWLLTAVDCSVSKARIFVKA